ncbi:MAG: hypothetical protein FIA91_07900 [Geobacter sp.]|nr:hypothetical protein [Geobacter sp.]
MKTTDCCGTENRYETAREFETVQIEKAKNSCSVCEEYSERHKRKPIAVICCDGACLRGEIARQAANVICHELLPQKTVRICLGGAFTKDTGQRSLVRNAGRVIALEGCHVNCASRMMQGVIPGLAPEVIIASRLYDMDRRLFGVEELPMAEIKAHARTVAEKVVTSL